MPRVDVTPTTLAQQGVYPAGVTGQADGHSFTNTGYEFIEVVNAHATNAYNVTIPTPVTRADLPVDDQIVSIPAVGRRLIGPFNVGYFNVQSGADQGKAYVNYQAGGEASLTLRVFRFPQA